MTSLLTLTLLACTGLGEGPMQEEEAVIAAMNDHYDAALAARDALVRGELEAAKKAASRVKGEVGAARTETEETLVAEVTDHATAASMAKDLPTAADHLGKMAHACGNCHTAASAKPALPDPTKPDWVAQKNEMLRHQWAVEMLWLGLIRPDEDAITTATAELGESPLAHHAEEMQPVPRAVELEVAVHQVAKSFGTETSKRGEHYGKLLATCAECHSLGAVTPKEVEKGQ